MTARRATIAAVVVLVLAVVVTSVLLVDRDPPPDASARSGPGRSAPTAAPEEAATWTSVGGSADPAAAPASVGLPEIAGDTGPMRVAADLAPPTNRWYSGMLFGEQPQPVFAVPLALLAEEGAITIGLPEVTATAKTIAAPFVGAPAARSASRRLRGDSRGSGVGRRSRIADRDDRPAR